MTIPQLTLIVNEDAVQIKKEFDNICKRFYNNFGDYALMGQDEIETDERKQFLQQSMGFLLGALEKPIVLTDRSDVSIDSLGQLIYYMRPWIDHYGLRKEFAGRPLNPLNIFD